MEYLECIFNIYIYIYIYMYTSSLLSHYLTTSLFLYNIMKSMHTLPSPPVLFLNYSSITPQLTHRKVDQEKEKRFPSLISYYFRNPLPIYSSPRREKRKKKVQKRPTNAPSRYARFPQYRISHRHSKFFGILY